MCILKKQAAPASPAWALTEVSGVAHLYESGKTVAAPPQPAGSARRKLWEFSPHAACPVIGVCLRLSDLTRLSRKVGIDIAGLSEYELHLTVVSESKKRSRLAEEVHKELEFRFALTVNKLRKIKTTEALDAWWQQELTGKQVAAVLWATLTHARCTAEIEYELLGRVHMMQHQIGMAVRADHSQLGALEAQNAQLKEELAAARQRIAAQAGDLSRRQDELHAQNMQLRGELVKTKTALGHALADLATLKQAIPDLCERAELEEKNRQLLADIRSLNRMLAKCRDELLQKRRRDKTEPAATVATEAPALASPAPHRLQLHSEPVKLQDRTVLCVGGRTANIPIYRELVEHKGARFLHHDGGEEEHAGKLVTALVAADLILCQVGCVSHNAYWRVKEHCKRHNKPCVFVETPSRTALERALTELNRDDPENESTGGTQPRSSGAR